MPDKKRIICSKCGEKLEKDDKFCPNCGKGKKNNKKLIIGVIVLLSILVIISSMILSGLVPQNQSLNNISTNVGEDRFLMEVIVAGEKFYLPEGSEVYTTRGPNNTESGGEVMFTFPDSEGVLFSIGPITTSLDEISRSLENKGNTVYGYVAYGGYSGVKSGNSEATMFTFERNGKSIEIVVSHSEGHDSINVDEYFTKIIG